MDEEAPQEAAERSASGSERVADGTGEEESPEAGFDRTVEEGVRRLDRGWSEMLATGLVGGVDVGTGVLALLLVEEATGSKILGGLAFAVGFVALTLARSELFTEDFLVPVAAVVSRQSNVVKLARLWFFTLVTNLVGGWVVMLLVMHGLPKLDATAIESATFYNDLGLGWQAFCLAVIGGMVITLMTWMQHTTPQVGSKLTAAVTSGFLLGAGQLNHAIVVSLVMFGALHTGHAPFGYGDWLGTLALATFGNLVGGIGLVTMLRLLQVPGSVKRERSAPDRT